MEPSLKDTDIIATPTLRTNLWAPLQASRNFTSLWSGQSLSQFGDAVLWVTLPLAVYAQSRSTLEMGYIMGLLMFPQVLLLPFAGILVDRVSRVRLMLSTESVRCGLVAILSFLAATHRMNFSVLGGFVFLYGVMDALFQPAYSAVRAQIFTEDIRNPALSLTQISMQMSRLLGPALGGVIVGFFSVSAGFALDAVTLALSLATLTFLRLPPPGAKEQMESGESSLRNFVQELMLGVTELRKHAWLWITIVAFCVINIAEAGLMTILVPWLIKVHLDLTDSTYGLVSSASGVGAILVAILFSRRNTWHRRGLIAYSGTGFSGICLLLLPFAHQTVILMMLVAGTSAGIMLFGLVWEGSLQELVPTEAYGRVASLDLFGSWALLPVGNVFTGWLAATIGGANAMWAEAGFMVFVVAFVVLVPSIRRFD